MKTLTKSSDENFTPIFPLYGKLQNKYLMNQFSPSCENEISAFIRQNLGEFDHQEKIQIEFN